MLALVLVLVLVLALVLALAWCIRIHRHISYRIDAISPPTYLNFLSAVKSPTLGTAGAAIPASTAFDGPVPKVPRAL